MLLTTLAILIPSLGKYVEVSDDVIADDYKDDVLTGVVGDCALSWPGEVPAAQPDPVWWSGRCYYNLH